MSMFGRSSNATPNAPTAASASNTGQQEQQREQTSGGTNVANAQTLVSKGTVIKGDIETAGNLRIDGKVKGHIKCSGTLVLGPGAHIEGDLLALKAEVAGDVHGNVEATELLTLKATANIKGDLYTAKLVIEVGAMFNGNCNMGAATKQINVGQQAASK